MAKGEPRRGNGEGTKPRQISENSFEIRIRRAGYPDKYIYGKTAADCIRKRNTWLASPEAQAPPTTSAPIRTVAAKIDKFLAEKTTLKPNGYRTYEGSCRLYIRPAIGHLDLRKLTGDHIKELLDDMQTRYELIREEKGEDARAPGSRTQEIAWKTVKAIFHKSIPYLLDDVPCPVYNPKEMTCWTDEQTNQLLSWVDQINDPMAMLFHLDFGTGMRKGELLALTVDKFDPVSRKLKVWSTWDEKTRDEENKAGVATDPKTPSSKRTITLRRDLAERLERYIEERGFGPKDRLFDARKGFSPSHISHRFETLIEEAGTEQNLPQIRFHDIRHTFATSCLAKGFPVHYVTKALGHKDARVTLTIYAHVLPGHDDEMMEAVGAGYSGKLRHLRAVS